MSFIIPTYRFFFTLHRADFTIIFFLALLDEMTLKSLDLIGYQTLYTIQQWVQQYIFFIIWA